MDSEQKLIMIIITVLDSNLEKNKSCVPSSPERYCEREKSLKFIKDAPFEYLIAVNIPVKIPIKQKTIMNKVVFLFSLNVSNNLYLSPLILREELKFFIV